MHDPADPADLADPADPLDELAATLRRPLRHGAAAVAHERPWRGEPGRALAVALPTDVEEVRRVVRWARRHGIRLLPQGAVTGLVGASTPPPQGPPPLVVSTDALTGRLEIDPTSATAVVSAGVRLSALNEAAGAHGLELPIDLAADPALGAMVATDTGGSRVLRYGDMAAHVLGLQVVVADEEATVLGDLRGLRKDNTGPDPLGLFVGSSGAFGIITAVSVALSPRPAERVTALVGPLDDTEAIRLLTHLRTRLADRLSAFEVMCPTAIAAAAGHMADPPNVDAGRDPQVTVLVESSGDLLCEEMLVESVATFGTGASDAALMVPAAATWGLRHAITVGLRDLGTVIGFDLSVLPSAIPALRARGRELVARHRADLLVADFGHWGDGGVHFNVVVPHGVTLPEAELEELRDAVFGLVVDELGGSFSAEHGIGPLNARWWLRTTSGLQRSVLAAFKAEVDPLGILGHPGVPFA